MGWIKEAKEVKQQKYGVYVHLCSLYQETPVPYHNFTLEILETLKRRYKNN